MNGGMSRQAPIARAKRKPYFGSAFHSEMAALWERAYAPLFRAVVASAICGGFAAPTFGQNIPAPLTARSVDENGMDLINQEFRHSYNDLSIGSGDSRLSLIRSGYDISNNNFNITYYYEQNTGNVTISGNGISKLFQATNGGLSHVDSEQSGESLTLLPGGATAEYVTRDGAKYYFDIIGPSDIIKSSKITYPDGKVERLFWKTIMICNSSGLACDFYSRLQSVTNNFGYQIKFEYVTDSYSESDPSSLSPWQTISKATAVNNSIEYCDPNSDHCPLSSYWPSSSYSRDGWEWTAILPGGRSWKYKESSDSNSLILQIQSPGSSTYDFSVYTSRSSSRIQIEKAGSTWNYDFSDGIVTRTDPVGNILKAQSVAYGVVGRRLTRSLAPIGQQLAYDYDTYGRLIKTTWPEGNYSIYAYDDRGNLVSSTSTAKTGSGLGSVGISASFPTTCVNPLTCNKPTSSTDEAGNVTDYTYDSAHGGILTATLAAPSTGAARPQVRNTYAAYQASYKNNAGAVVPSGEPIYRLVSSSTCASGGSCSATGAEVVTAIAYGAQSTGTPNNLLSTSRTVSAGDGSLSATTTTSYDWIGNVTSVDGPLPGAVDTSRYIYNSNRQVVGVIGPDPDGSGTLLPRAQKITYDAQGDVTWTELGT